jgi:predicted Zn-dependent protease with MMP-like domain
MREATTDTDNLETEQAERDAEPGGAAAGELPPATGGGWRDYYAALGVAPFASHEQIHRAYRRLAKRWHPDRYTRASKQLRLRAERQMRMFTAAYAVLGDEAKRRTYDERRHAFGWTEASTYHTATTARASAYREESEAGNPNGAGVLAGVLALILALALLGGALNGGFGSDPVPLVIFGGIALLLVIGAIFATSGSPLARHANAWMEGEPRGYRVRYEQPSQDQRRTAADADEAEDEVARFERLVDEALEDVPEEFRPYLENVVVRVEDAPSAATLREANVQPGHTLLGLYHGVPLTKQGIAGAGPEIISIYRLPIERYCGGDPDAIRGQVRATVLHELAHHFGIDHDEMPDWVK